MEHSGNRDLMVVLREANLAPELMQAETEWLHSLLNRVEMPRNVAQCSEVINLTRYKVEKKFDKVLKEVLSPNEKPFVFLFVKN